MTINEIKIKLITKLFMNFKFILFFIIFITPIVSYSAIQTPLSEEAKFLQGRELSIVVDRDAVIKEVKIVENNIFYLIEKDFHGEFDLHKDNLNDYNYLFAIGVCSKNEAYKSIESGWIIHYILKDINSENSYIRFIVDDCSKIKYNGEKVIKIFERSMSQLVKDMPGVNVNLNGKRLLISINKATTKNIESDAKENNKLKMELKDLFCRNELNQTIFKDGYFVEIQISNHEGIEKSMLIESCDVNFY